MLSVINNQFVKHRRSDSSGGFYFDNEIPNDRQLDTIFLVYYTFSSVPSVLVTHRCVVKPNLFVLVPCHTS